MTLVSQATAHSGSIIIFVCKKGFFLLRYIWKTIWFFNVVYMFYHFMETRQSVACHKQWTVISKIFNLFHNQTFKAINSTFFSLVEKFFAVLDYVYSLLVSNTHWLIHHLIQRHMFYVDKLRNGSHPRCLITDSFYTWSCLFILLDRQLSPNFKML